MAEQSVEYRRLPGRMLIYMANRQCLYAGPDHLLLLTTSYFTESYKRFYYGDIQAVTLQKTSTGAAWNMLLGLSLAVLVAAIAMPFLFDGEGWAVLAVFAAIFAGAVLAALVVNVAKGPTCDCYIVTAVHQEQIRSLGRVRAARKALALLQPILKTVQGELNPDNAEEALAAACAGREPNAPAGAMPAHAPRRDSGNVHLALFLFVFVDAAVRVAGILSLSFAPYALMLLVTLALLCLIVAALVRQHRNDMPPPLRNTVWALFIYACFLAGVVYIYEVMRQMEMQLGMQGQKLEFTEFRQILTQVTGVVAVACDVILGSLGLVFLRNYLRFQSAAETAAAETAAPET